MLGILGGGGEGFSSCGSEGSLVGLVASSGMDSSEANA